MTDLGELGLSSYEEQVYRTLLVTGATTATELSEASGVPRGRIYDVLNGLEAREIVRSHPTEPTQYRPAEPGVAVDRLLAERVRELDRERERYREIAGDAQSNLLPDPPADGSVWLGGLGSDAMCEALERHATTASECVHAVVGPPYEHASWDVLRAEFDSFFRGTGAEIDVSLLVSDEVLDVLPDSFPELVPDRSGSVVVRALPEVPVSYDVVDRAIATIDVPHPRSRADRLGVVGVTGGDVVDRLEEQFQASWGEAVPLLE